MHSINLLHRKHETSAFVSLRNSIGNRGKYLIGVYLLIFIPVMGLSFGLEYQINKAVENQTQLQQSVVQLAPIEHLVRSIKRRMLQIQTITSPPISIADTVAQLPTSLTVPGVLISDFTLNASGQVRFSARASDSVVLQGFEQRLVQIAQQQQFTDLTLSSIAYTKNTAEYMLEVAFALGGNK